MNSPICVIRLLLGCLKLFPIIDKIHQGLRFNGRAWHVLQTMRPELSGPLGDSSCGLSVLDDVSQGSRTYHSDGVTLEVLRQLPSCHEHPVTKLLPMRVPL